jgi:flagellar basal body-associated protein FliL
MLESKALLKATVRRQHVKRLMIVLSVGVVMAMVVVAGAAPTIAQTSEDKAAQKAAKQEQKAAKQQQKAAKQQAAKQQAAKQQQPLPKSGGVELNALLLPATVLLVGSGIVAAYVVRHYRR